MGSHDRREAGPPRPGPTPAASTVRRVLLCGFAAVFTLWLVSAVDLVRRIGAAQHQIAAIASAFTSGEDLLFTIRESVLLSSIYARDELLDARPDAASFYRDRLEAARDELERARERYALNVDAPLEREHWTRLETELDEYWMSLAPFLTGRTAADRSERDTTLRRELSQRRDLIVRMADDIRRLNHDALQQQQAEVVELHRVLRRRIVWTSGIAVALGLLIVLAAARYTGQLEARVHRQRLEEQRHERELQRLAARLVHAQEDERRTIGRDLHDEIGQALLTIKLGLGAVERSGQVRGQPADALQEAKRTTDTAIQTVRDLSQLLHPAMLDDFGLSVTLDAYVRRFSERTGMQGELVLDRMDGRLPGELEVCVYRIVQEALANVARHARAASCRVYLQRLPHSLLVTVEDDGRGVERDQTSTDGRRGTGLVGIRERAAELGGTVHLDSRAGRGTRLTVELPVLRDRDDPPPIQPGAPLAALGER